MDDLSSGPVFATINDTCARYGIRPSKLYELLGLKVITAKKFGKRVLIDLRSAQKYFDELPEAGIKPSQRVRERMTTRLYQELAAATTHREAQAVLAAPEYQAVINAMPDGEREGFLAAVQDAIAEKSGGD
jgi:hypothetical protein